MSDTSEPNSDDKNKGFHIDKRGFHCIPCRCKRQLYHKESKTVKEEGKTTINTVEDRRKFKFGGRNQSPDEIFSLKMFYKQVVLKYVIQVLEWVGSLPLKKIKKGYLN